MKRRTTVSGGIGDAAVATPARNSYQVDRVRLTEGANIMTMHLESSLSTLSDERRWQAVLNHDASFDGQFVYAVASTGIFCRPSCPSRRPKDANVRFFDGPAQAKEAGYRPCKRCRPDGERPDVHLARRAVELLESSQERLTLTDLSHSLDVSPSHLQRVFKRVIGVSPHQYASRLRSEKVKSTLRDRDDVTSSLYEAGYGSSSRLYEQAARDLGMTPGAYLRGGEGMSITYAVAGSPLGALLVAWTERGVCAVTLGDGADELAANLRAEYPKAEIQRSSEAGPWIGQVLDYLHGELRQLDLPLDLQATAFQLRVWSELRKIPFGETRSYGEIAQSIDRPRASRAVANACAANPVALTVPCHRVLPASGATGGYRWGAERKSWLLVLEQSGEDMDSSILCSS